MFASAALDWAAFDSLPWPLLAVGVSTLRVLLWPALAEELLCWTVSAVWFTDSDEELEPSWV